MTVAELRAIMALLPDDAEIVLSLNGDDEPCLIDTAGVYKTQNELFLQIEATVDLPEYDD